MNSVEGAGRAGHTRAACTAAASRPAAVDPPVGQRLRRLRLARGLSQSQLAERLCVASGRATVRRHEISRWERGVRTPSLYWLTWLATVLHVPPSVFAERRHADTRPPA